MQPKALVDYPVGVAPYLLHILKPCIFLKLTSAEQDIATGLLQNQDYVHHCHPINLNLYTEMYNFLSA